MAFAPLPMTEPIPESDRCACCAGDGGWRGLIFKPMNAFARTHGQHDRFWICVECDVRLRRGEIGLPAGVR